LGFSWDLVERSSWCSSFDSSWFGEFGGSNHSYEVPMRYSYYPKVSCKSVEWVGRSGRIFGGINLWIVIHPERPGCDQSERCSTPVWTVLLFVRFWPRWTFWGVGLSLGLQLFWVCAGLAFGVSGSCTWVFFARTDLTGVLYRSDQCRAFPWKIASVAWVTRLEV
jgi:hypothetical protein